MLITLLHQFSFHWEDGKDATPLLSSIAWRMCLIPFFVRLSAWMEKSMILPSVKRQGMKGEKETAEVKRVEMEIKCSFSPFSQVRTEHPVWTEQTLEVLFLSWERKRDGQFHPALLSPRLLKFSFFSHLWESDGARDQRVIGESLQLKREEKKTLQGMLPDSETMKQPMDDRNKAQIQKLAVSFPWQHCINANIANLCSHHHHYFFTTMRAYRNVHRERKHCIPFLQKIWQRALSPSPNVPRLNHSFHFLFFLFHFRPWKSLVDVCAEVRTDN